MLSAPLSTSNISMSVEAATATSPPHHQSPQPKAKKKRNQPGTPDPDAEVIALSPKSLVTTNRFVCEVCNKAFQRDQNLQLHRRGHNLPWNLKGSSKTGASAGSGSLGSGDQVAGRKRVYVCPEPSCVHHDPSRALGDLTGIKKHFSRKHGEKKWRCERCAKCYAVCSDWKAHLKVCGTREYRCDCGILFTRKDSLITHRAFCDALAQESARVLGVAAPSANHLTSVNGSSMLNVPLPTVDNLHNGSLFLPMFTPSSDPNPNDEQHFLNPNTSSLLPIMSSMDFVQPQLNLTAVGQPTTAPPSLTVLHSNTLLPTGNARANNGLSGNHSITTLLNAGNFMAGFEQHGASALAGRVSHDHIQLTRDFLGGGAVAGSNSGVAAEHISPFNCLDTISGSSHSACSSDLNKRFVSTTLQAMNPAKWGDC